MAQPVQPSTSSRPLRRTRCGGFTLIEALMTVAVLGIGLAYILSAFNAAARENLSMQEYDNVSALAAVVCDELNATPDITFSTGNNGSANHADFPGYSTTLNASLKTAFSYKGHKVHYYDIVITVTTPSYKRYSFRTCKMVRE